MPRQVDDNKQAKSEQIRGCAQDVL